jgi:flagellar biosynthetic protein FlhB
LSGSSEDRTESATAQRLLRARAEGNIPLSRDLTSVISLAAGTLVLMLMGSASARTMAVWLRGYWEHLADLDATTPAPMRIAVSVALRGAAPVVLAGLLGGVTMSLLQSGFVLRPLAPDWGRISPLAGLRRLFGADQLMETGKAVVKLVALSFGLWHLMASHLAIASIALEWSAAALLETIRHDIIQLLLYLIAAQLMITGFDVLWVRVRHAGRLRMSRTEIKDEHRETEGDPRIKARLRQIRQMRTRRRMLAAVPKATLVVTNPTHYAVALVYARGQAGAPRVVAKGVDEVALRIREVARAHRVPVTPNPPLARALYGLELDAEIPAEHFKLVAELIAYVWRLDTRARGRL